MQSQTQILINLLLDLLPFLIPILLIQLGLVIFALLDLSKREQVKGGKTLWAILLVVTAFGLPSGMLVAAIYLAWGRNIEAVHDTH